MDKKTVLFDAHSAMGARIVPFGGWAMPLHYGSQLDEHHAVRRDAGMFDVSHMQVVDIAGSEAKAFLRSLLANDVDRLKVSGKALYSCMLNPEGGVIDDLIVYFLTETDFRMVVNAATSEKDLAWINERASGYAVKISPRTDLAMVAVQGPNAREKAIPNIPSELQEQAAELGVFQACTDGAWFVARTGYTGEDGFEVMLPESEAEAFWQALAQAGVAPCGLGARDTLRLEAGMNLYGTDMDEETSPLEAGLNWTVAWEPADRSFVGRDAMQQLRDSGNARKFVGLLLTGRGVLRNHQKVFANGSEVGEITSGGFSPTLERSIAMARVEAGVEGECEVEIRGKLVPARIVKAPFVRNGEARVEL